MEQVQQLLKALEFFQDWSNYLLVLTVAAIGWVVASREKFSRLSLLRTCLACFGASTLFGILTLALIPQVAESLNSSSRSIYAAIGWVRLSVVSWPQYVLFLVGVALFIWGTVERRQRPRPAQVAVPVVEDNAHRRRTFNPDA
jgi:hypothetical protein